MKKQSIHKKIIIKVMAVISLILFCVCSAFISYTFFVFEGKMIQEYIPKAVAIFFVSIGLIFIILNRLIKKVTNPISDLSEILKKVTEQNDYSIRAEKISKNEWECTFDSLNSMLAKIQETNDLCEQKIYESKAIAKQESDKTSEKDKQLKDINQKLGIAEKKAAFIEEVKFGFLSNISSGIRIPINDIINSSEILTKTELTNAQKDLISEINKKGERLLTHVNDILDAAKIEADSLILEHIEFNLKYLVESIVKEIKPKAQEKNIDLMCMFPKKMNYDFKGDPTRIRQIILNLLNNAIKFTDKGEIFITIGNQENTNTISISIKDTGIGINKSSQEHIFDAFSKADSKDKNNGIGLGLTIARTLTRKMNGEINFRSQLGRGSEFIVVLELEQINNKEGDLVEMLPLEEIKGKKCLIIDENTLSFKIIENICKEIALKILPAIDLKDDILKQMEQNNIIPDIILLDLMVSDLKDNEFINKIKQNENYKHIKIIGIISDIMPGTTKYFQEKGFDAYLAKPIKKDDFINVICAVFGSKTNGTAKPFLTKHNIKESLKKNIKILAAEDNPVNQRLIKESLKKLKCNVDIVSNGKEVLEKIKNKEYDICFMDIRMPIMGGIETVNKIRTEFKIELPIIGLITEAEKEEEKNYLDAGFNDFIAKPVKIEDLQDILIKWAGK